MAASLTRARLARSSSQQRQINIRYLGLLACIVVTYKICVGDFGIFNYHDSWAAPLPIVNDGGFIEGITDHRKNWNGTGVNIYLDIAVPVSGQDKKLDEFAKFLGSSIQQFKSRTKNDRVTIRLLVTRYPSDNSSYSLLQSLAKAASLSTQYVKFVSVKNPSQFSRTSAINALQNKRDACHSKNCVIAIVDVDLQVGPGFIVNALSYVAPQKVYFPVVWSEFNPENIKLMDNLIGPLSKYSEHRGLWRTFGFGMYAISGADASSMLMNTTFVGWGGEDNDFHSRVKGQNWTIVREEEPDLVHVWHPKYCKVGSFVDKTWYNTW
jgi:Sec-independent protein translocase protein TatA